MHKPEAISEGPNVRTGWDEKEKTLFERLELLAVFVQR